jgi:sRNA-binding carbon storage regulator CsrA
VKINGFDPNSYDYEPRKVFECIQSIYIDESIELKITVVDHEHDRIEVDINFPTGVPFLEDFAEKIVDANLSENSQAEGL